MFTQFYRQYPLIFVRFQTTSARKAGSTTVDKFSSRAPEESSHFEKFIRDKDLSNITVTSFYTQTIIEQYALKVSHLKSELYNFHSIIQVINTFISVDDDVHRKNSRR